MGIKMQEISKPGKDERRANIMQIAREVFLREGYAATSMSKIAAMVGGSKATLYSYFPSKKDLFFAVVDAESGRVLDDLYQIDAGCTDVREALRAFCRRFVTLMLSDFTTGFDRIITAESVRFPEIGQAAYEFGYKRGVDRMETLMRLGMEAGVLRRVNSRTAAETLLNLCSGHLHKLRQWNVITKILPHDLEAQIALTTAAFLALFGNDELAAEARQFTGL
jgi:TetR/AcrR family transcriptional regulator, mexJK operon transcriptional repressor